MGVHRASGSSPPRSEKSIDGRRANAIGRESGAKGEAAGRRRFNCLHESQRVLRTLTRPRQPRGWLTQEYIVMVVVMGLLEDEANGRVEDYVFWWRKW